MHRHQIRRFLNKGPLNILVIGATHERYEQQLCKTGHNFICVEHGKKWDHDYGEQPENYRIHSSIPTDIAFDLVLIHVSGERFNIGAEISNMFKIPLIRHTHTIPQSEMEVRVFHSQKPHIDTFISQYSKDKWVPQSESFVVNHGLDTEFWKPVLEVRHGKVLSVVNFWKDRDWACGWKLYEEVKKRLPDVEFKVLGKNPGLSFPARNLDHLRYELSTCSVFLNTSQNSPIPMSLMEAMACGAPIVSSDTCMIPEVLAGAGILGKTATELANGISSILTNPHLGVELSERARSRIELKYNINNFVNTWNEVFEYAVTNF